MPITIGSLTNVPAPGDPIRSDWPQSISTLVDRLPKGVIARGLKTSLQAGLAAVETVITELTIAGPTVANRWTRLYYGLAVIPPAATAAGVPVPIVTVTARYGTTTAGASIGANQHNIPESWRGFDNRPNIFGEFVPTALNAGQQVCLTFVSTGPTYSVGASSFFLAADYGAST